MRESDELAELLARAGNGDETAVNELFSRYRKRLTQMVRLRLNRLLRSRVDDSDILQETYLEAAKRLPDYLLNQPLPFFLWLRQITGEKIIDVHRRHLGAKMRNAGNEISLHRGPMPMASSASLAALLKGRLTLPSQAAIKGEVRKCVQDVLNSMETIDREILTLRHFERLTNVEVAETLGMNESTTSSRYLRALKRLKDELSQFPGLFDG
jgi:RNA polymerase sigma-70 factor (ECF subfamily)